MHASQVHRQGGGCGTPHYHGARLGGGAAGSVTSRLCEDFALHPIDRDEQVTCEGLLERERSARLVVMPTHHVDECGDLTGFKYECSMYAGGACLPVSRKSFFGHTAVECAAGPKAILALMSDPEGNRDRMLRFLQDTERRCVSATLDHIPDNSDTMLAGVGAPGQHGGGGQFLLHGTSDLRAVDCRAWHPGVPESIGLYHAYVRGCSRDVRTHKLFLVCSGGLEEASNAFCNLLIDVGTKCTAKEVADSEEVWWLRKASLRARCRLLYNLAEAFGLAIPHMQDIQAHDAESTYIATHCTDTLEHDITCNPTAGTVSVFNGCCDTTKRFNGILTRMQPGEGMWLFRGAQRGGEGFGSLFGDARVCGAFPTSQPRVAVGVHSHLHHHGPRPPHIVTLTGSGGGVVAASSTAAPLPRCVVSLKAAAEQQAAASAQQYLCFDEAYFKTLERMQWNRDNGFIELMPIVVGMQ